MASHSVSVSIINDTDSESDESFTLTFTDSGTSAFVASGTGTIQDDDGGSNTGGGGGMGPSNNLPTISAIAAQSFDEDTSLVLNITIGDAETAAGNLTLAVDSMTDSTLFPSGTITFGGSGANRTVTLAPLANVNGTGTVSIIVSDGDGGTFTRSFQVTVNAINDPPVITNAVNRTNAEGDSVTWTVIVTDPDVGDTWVMTSIVGLPNGVAAYPGGFQGHIHYDTAGVHTVTVTVVDTAGCGLMDVKSFTWTITDRTFTSLKGTEVANAVAIATANQIVVTSVSPNTIFLQPGNTLALSLISGVPLPDLGDVYYQLGPDGGPVMTEGTFNSSTNVAVQDGWVLKVGIDINCNMFLSTSEVTHGFRIRVINFDNATIKDARIWDYESSSTALNESPFTVKEGEIFDTRSKFSVEVCGFVAPGISLIRNRVIDGSSIQADHANPSFDFAPAGNSDSVWFRFYYDANNNGAYDAGEATIKSPNVKVKPLNPIAYSFDYSSAITPGITVAAAQAATDVGVRRLRMRNSEDDFRAAVKIIMTAAPTPTFTPDATHPDPINEMNDEGLHFNSMTGSGNHIRFISGWVGFQPGKRGSQGLALDGGFGILVSWPDKALDTIVHEIGHTLLGGDHFQGDRMNIMTGGPGEAGLQGRDPNANKLTAEQADKYSGLSTP